MKEINVNMTSNNIEDVIKLSKLNISNDRLTVPFGIIPRSKDKPFDDIELFYEDLASIPNMIVSGTVSTGKTLFIQYLLYMLLKQYPEENYKFLLIDTKGVDYRAFNGLNALEAPVYTDKNRIGGAINWINSIINRRIADPFTEKNHIFFVVDDFASYQLNDEDKKVLIESIILSYRTNVHFIFVTATPNFSILPTEIKAAIPCRISFTTVTSRESRLVIDDIGAEKLPYPGTFIYKNYSKKIILSVPQINVETFDSEIFKIKQSQPSPFDCSIMYEIEKMAEMAERSLNSEFLDDYDSSLNNAITIAIADGGINSTILQKKLGLGYARACRVSVQLGELGVIGPYNGIQPRALLITKQTYNEKLALYGPILSESGDIRYDFKIHNNNELNEGEQSDGNDCTKENIVSYDTVSDDCDSDDFYENDSKKIDQNVIQQNMEIKKNTNDMYETYIYHKKRFKLYSLLILGIVFAIAFLFTVLNDIHTKLSLILAVLSVISFILYKKENKQSDNH